MHAFLYHFNFEFRTGIRNPQLLFLNYLFPLSFYLIMGFTYCFSRYLHNYIIH